MDKDKGKKLNDGIFDIVLGSIIMTGSNFTGGILLEKILVLLGLLIFTVGVIRTIINIKGKNKKGLSIFLGILGVISTAAFIGLLIRLILSCV